MTGLLYETADISNCSRGTELYNTFVFMLITEQFLETTVKVAVLGD
jgi:hypothetical protein